MEELKEAIVQLTLENGQLRAENSKLKAELECFWTFMSRLEDSTNECIDCVNKFESEE